MSDIEQTLSIIKPDAVERNLESEIKKEFINSGFKISKEKKSIELFQYAMVILDTGVFFLW